MLPHTCDNFKHQQERQTNLTKSVRCKYIQQMAAQVQASIKAFVTEQVRLQAVCA